jgi:hypothetical protein
MEILGSSGIQGWIAKLDHPGDTAQGIEKERGNMTEIPNTGQLALLLGSVALFAIGGAVSLSRIRWERSWSRLAAKACMWSAITLPWAFLSGTRCPPELDAAGGQFRCTRLAGLLVAGFVMYVQRQRPIGGLDWFLMPMVVLVLVAAAVLDASGLMRMSPALGRGCTA